MSAGAPSRARPLLLLLLRIPPAVRLAGRSAAFLSPSPGPRAKCLESICMSAFSPFYLISSVISPSKHCTYIDVNISHSESLLGPELERAP